MELIKTVGEVCLGEEDRSMPMVGVQNEPEDAMEGSPPLHGFRRIHFVGARVDPGECVIVNHLWPAISLGNAP